MTWNTSDENLILIGEIDGTINVHSRSQDVRARKLSALFNRPFELDGQMFASFEGFFNGIKHPEASKTRRFAFASCYGHAQRFGDRAQNNVVYFNGVTILSGSDDYHALIERAHRASIMQNPDVQEALIATAGLIIVHHVGTPERPDNPYPHARFCAELTSYRTTLINRTLG